MSRRPIPHGTISRYTLRRCRCSSCRVAWNAYRREHQRELDRGEPRTIPADEAREHVRKLMRRGFSMPAIADAAGVSRPGIGRIVTGSTARIRRGAADRILAIPLDEPIPGHEVPARLVRPLIRACVRAGISRKRLYASAGLHANYRGAKGSRVSWETYRRLTVLYRLLSRRGVVPVRLDLEVIS